jgi:hypothetical protein
MMRVMLLVSVMYAFAGGCLFLQRWLKPTTWLGRVSEFAGVAVSYFATGLVFLVCYALLFPSQNQAARNTMSLRAVEVRLSALEQQVDSLRRE